MKQVLLILIAWVFLLLAILMLGKGLITGLNDYTDNQINKKKCENHAIMYNKSVTWMDGYKVCFNVETGKAINLENDNGH